MLKSKPRPFIEFTLKTMHPDNSWLLNGWITGEEPLALAFRARRDQHVIMSSEFYRMSSLRTPKPDGSFPAAADESETKGYVFRKTARFVLPRHIGKFSVRFANTATYIEFLSGTFLPWFPIDDAPQLGVVKVHGDKFYLLPLLEMTLTVQRVPPTDEIGYTRLSTLHIVANTNIWSKHPDNISYFHEVCDNLIQYDEADILSTQIQATSRKMAPHRDQLRDLFAYWVGIEFKFD